MAKKLIIDCGICDARGTTEQTLAAYEDIQLDCGTLLVTAETRELLNRHRVNIDCGSVLELDRDVRLRQINGHAQLKSTDVPAARTYLVVNGVLQIEPGAGQALSGCAGITVNGRVVCPESLSGSLGAMAVNGALELYPDEAVLLKRSAVIDRTFALRARERLYWSARRMIFVDPALDPGRLAEKGARFSSREMILAEGLVQGLVELLDERSELIIVPDGTAVLQDDVELSERTIRSHGRKLYILGHVKVPREAGQALEALEYLNIQGDVDVAGELEALLAEKANVITGDVRVMKGRCLCDRISVAVSRQMLEGKPGGLSVRDCVNVRLDPDIPPELIVRALEISDCVNVDCAQEQEAAVSLISSDVVQIGSPPASPAPNGDLSVKTINCAEYLL